MSLLKNQIHHQKFIEESIRQCIKNVSATSRYQIRLVLFFSFVSVIATMQIFSSNLFYMNPVFYCNGSDAKQFEETACPQIQTCTIENPETMTAQLQLYCDDRKDDRTLIQTAQGIGMLLAVFISYFIDRFGKKYIFCASLLLLVLACIFQFVGAFSNNIILLFMADLLIGITAKIQYFCCNTLITRFLGRHQYVVATLVILINFGVSNLIIAGLNMAFHDWRVIAGFYSAALIVLSVLAFMVLQQDPIFLFEIGKIDQVKQIIRQVGRINAQNPEVIEQNAKKIDHLFAIKSTLGHGRGAEEMVGSFSIKEIIRCDIFQTALIVSLAGGFYQMAQKSMELSIQGLQYSYNFNLFIIGISSICGYVLAMYFNKFEQQSKAGLIATSLLYTILALLFIFPFVRNNGNIETVILFLLRSLVCWSSNYCIRLSFDLFPEKYQVTIISLIELVANMGVVAAPAIVQFSVDHQIEPILSVSALRFVFGILPVFFLIEQKIHLSSQCLETP